MKYVIKFIKSVKFLNVKLLNVNIKLNVLWTYSKSTFNHDDPIRKLLVPINQSPYFICFCYNLFEIAKEINTYEIKSSRLGSQILTCFIFLDLFKKKTLQKSNTPEKMLVQEELDCVIIDDIGFI